MRDETTATLWRQTRSPQRQFRLPFVMTAITRIVVPTDFSPTADAALTYAKRLAGQFEASLHLVHAFEDPFTTAAFASEAYTTLPLGLREQLLGEAGARLDERLTPDERVRFTASTEIVSGTPTRTIVEYAGSLGADLIVMGTHGRGGMAHVLLGSVAERVVRTAPCSVLTLAPARSERGVAHPHSLATYPGQFPGHVLIRPNFSIR